MKTTQVGDSVLLSFSYCTECRDCKTQHPSFCQNFMAINYGGQPEVFSLNGGLKAPGLFFGQSSFSNLSIVKENSAVNVTKLVKNEEELKLFAPLGCGFQTGMGTIDVLAATESADTIVILGLGGVGLAAVVVSCYAIYFTIQKR